MKFPSPVFAPALVLLMVAFASAAGLITGGTPAIKHPGRASSPSKAPMIVHKHNGTFVVQKVPSKKPAKNATQKGLIIPPQVVVPMVGSGRQN